MAMVPLRDVVADAHRALEAGEYNQALAACEHVLKHFPSYADIHRLSGEILLEQGNTVGARISFDRALEFDPQNVLATLGLGVIAEEGLDLSGAAEAFQRALEIDPSLIQLRDELVRLYSKLYGQGGRLRVSGPGLAAIYARGNQLTLARRQYEAMIEQLPERTDLVLALAEVKWRADDLAGAATLCQRAMETRPGAVRALYLQGDVLRQQGNAERARERFTAASRIDPSGDIARALEMGKPAAVFVDRMLHEHQVTAFDPSTVQTIDTPTTNTLLGVTTPPVEESEWRRITTDLAATLGVTSPGDTPDTMAFAIAAAEPLTALQSDEIAVFVETSNDADLGEQVEPSTATSAMVDPPSTISDLGDDETDSTADLADGPPVDLLAEWERATGELQAATPDIQPVRGYTDTLREFDALGVRPFTAETGALNPDTIAPGSAIAAALVAASAAAVATAKLSPMQAPPETQPTYESATLEIAPQMSVASTPAIVLAPNAAIEPATPSPSNAGLDQLVANWDEIDQELQAATPSSDRESTDELSNELAALGIDPFMAEPDARVPQSSLSDHLAALEPFLASPPPGSPLVPGFTQELRALDEAGIAPFDYGDLDAGGAPDPGQRQSHSSPVVMDLEPNDADETWAGLQAELNAAIPQTGSLMSGFTSDLREFDQAGLAPFQPTDLLVATSLRSDQPMAPVQPSPATDVGPGGGSSHAPAAIGPGAESSSVVSTTGASVDVPAVPAEQAPRYLDVSMNPLASATNPVLPDSSSWASNVVVAPTLGMSSSAIAAPTSQTSPATSAQAKGQAQGSAAPLAAPPSAPASRLAPPIRTSSSQSTLLRPSVFGATISLSGSLFARLHQRKSALVERGEITIKRRAPSLGESVASKSLLIEAAEVAADSLPTDSVTRRQLAETYAAAGQAVDAAAQYRLLVRNEPTMLGELAGSIQALAAAYPHEPAVTRLVGDLYLRQGRYSQAMDVFRRLLQSKMDA